jgi:membrane-bound serine protease (ClpP class)
MKQLRCIRKSSLTLLALWCIAMLCGVCSAQAEAPKVLVLQLDDTIQPISQDYLARGVAEAAQQHAAALLVEINTPGGLLDSTREMVRNILDSATPVILYVTPAGSRAASAGFFLLESSDIAAMAPGTNTGAAHPVLEGARLDPIMKQKVENDATAFLRSYVSRRGRNVEAAQAGVLESKSYTETEALNLHLIDVTAPNDRALLDELDGRTITRFNGAKQVLHTRGAELVDVTPSLRERILDKLMDPNLAVLILLAGALLIYLEFHVPGTIVPGALGTLLVVLSLFALNLLPVRGTAWMMMLAALILMLLEAKMPSHGILAGTGTLLLVFGMLTLVNGPIPELRVQVATAVAAGIAFGLITTVLVRVAWKARRNKVMTGPDALVGCIGIAQEELAPRGQILVHGELWLAETTQPIPSGAPVRVRAVRGLTLLVDGVPQP